MTTPTPDPGLVLEATGALTLHGHVDGSSEGDPGVYLYSWNSEWVATADADCIAVVAVADRENLQVAIEEAIGDATGDPAPLGWTNLGGGSGAMAQWAPLLGSGMTGRGRFLLAARWWRIKVIAAPTEEYGATVNVRVAARRYPPSVVGQ